MSMPKETIEPTDATDPRHVRALARDLAKWRREEGLPGLMMVGMLPECEDQRPDADLSGELVDLGLACASEPGPKGLPRPVVGYLDTLPEASATSTGCQLHDAGVTRCIAAEWTVRAVVIGDAVQPGRVALVGRDEWARSGTSAWWRWSISLPWWLLADEAERARGLAHIAAQCGWTGEREAHIRRPDFAGFAHVIQRHGLAETKANAAALAKVASSKVLVEMLKRHYSAGAQGLLFGGSKVIEAAP
jgi:hypothetical protein